MPIGGSSIKLKKPENFGTLFGDTSATTDTTETGLPSVLPVEMLMPYSKHRFKLYEGERLNDMIESIKANGIICPIIVRKIDDSHYEILSGHNRVNAAKLAGFSEVPVIVKDNLTEEEAKLIVTETNLYQRGISDMSHSQRAFVLAAHMDAVRAQGKRSDIINEIEALMKSLNDGENSTLCQFGTKSDNLKESGEKYGLSRRNVARYLCIAKLSDEMLELLDDERIGLVAAVEISYISHDAQRFLAQRLDEIESYKLDIKKAELIRKTFKEGKLSNEVTEMILNGTYNQTAARKTIGTKTKNINLGFAQKYFAPTQSKKEIEEYIIRALEFYVEHSAEFEDNMEAGIEEEM